MSNQKKFDCVEMKRRLQEKVYEETKDMTWEERRDHFKRNIEASPFAEMWARLNERRKKADQRAS